MFYAHFVLAKKGPLARIWLAAHWDKKLTKAHVFETNIESSVDGILQPKVKLALRTSGHLLLGVVRIYSRKAKYLLADCNEAFVKIKMAFRPGMVDLPEEHREAAMNAITLPEVFHDFNTAMTELNDIDIEAQFSLNQTRAEEITMREDYGSLTLVTHDDGFGDMGFDTDTPDMMRDAIGGDQALEQSNLLFSDGMSMGVDLDRSKEPIPSTSEPMPGTSRAGLESDREPHIHDDGFGGTIGDDFEHAGGLFEGDLFGDVPAEASALTGALEEPSIIQPTIDSDDDMDHYDGGASPGGHSSDESRPTSALDLPGSDGPPLALPSSPQLMPPPSVPPMAPTPDLHEPMSEEPERGPTPIPEQTPDQTTLLQNEEESFALAPVDTSALKGITKAKRKRKLIVDEIKNISGEEMKNQLSDTTDIVTTLDLAPPTKRLMHWKETGGVEKLFALPSRHIPARALFKNYQRHLTSRAFEIEDFSALGPDILVPESTYPADDSTAFDTVARRITRKRKYPSDSISEGSKTPAHAPEMLEASPMLPPPQMPDITEQLDDDYDHFAEATEMMPPPATPGPGDMLLSEQMPPTPGMLPMTPGDSLHGGMTPGILPEGITPHHIPEGLPMTPGGITPAELEHGMDVDVDLPMPHIPGDQVSSYLEGTPEQLSHPSLMTQEILDPTTGQMVIQQLEQLPELGSIELGYDQQGQHMQMANMGYDEHAMETHTPRAPMSERVATPWHEDYEFPPSAGHPGEEQLQDETDEQFEERVLNKRAAQMFTSVRGKLLKQEHLFLSEMARHNNRKQAAQKFYSLLVLKKFQVLNISQDEPCGDIKVTRGPKFDNPAM